MIFLSVLGILFVCSCGRGQLDTFNVESIYENVANVEHAFGDSLTKKIIELAHEAYAGKFTPRQALEFFENLTPAERDGAARGVVTLVKELAKIVSDPTVEGQIQTAFQIAPFLLGQLVNSMPETPQRPEEPAETTTDQKMKSSPEKNNLRTESDDIPTPQELSGLFGGLASSGKMSDDLYEMMEELVRLADQYNDDDSPGDKLTMDDKSAVTLPRKMGGNETDEDGDSEDRVMEENKIESESGKDEL